MNAWLANAPARALSAAKTGVLAAFCVCGGARLVRWVARRAFPGAVRVLYCHDIAPTGADRSCAPGSLDVEEFERRLVHIRRHYGFISIEQARSRLRGEQAGGRIPVILTFDDGYRSFAEYVHPLLRRHDIPAALFVTTGAVGGSGIWSDDVRDAGGSESLIEELKLVPDEVRRRVVRELCERAGLRADRGRRILTWEELRELARDPLVTIGAHTVTHPILSRMGEEAAAREIRESKQTLERELGLPVTAFSYPNGLREDFTEHCRRVVADAGYRIAFSTMGGPAQPGGDLYAVPRSCLAREPWSRFVLRMAGRDELLARARAILRRSLRTGAAAPESPLRPSSIAGDTGET